MAEQKVEWEKRKYTAIYIAPSLMEEIRDAVVALAGPPASLTVTAFFENASLRELKHLKRRHNDGQDFPKRSTGLRRGRPVR